MSEKYGSMKDCKTRNDSQGLDKNYLGGDYFEMRECGKEKKLKRCRKEKIVTDQADLVAKKIGNGYPKMTNSQLRRFFSHARGVERRLKYADFEELKSEV